MAGYLSSDATETWTLFDVSAANYGVLVNEGASVTNRVDIFNDLGSGNDYGSRVVSVADEPAPNTGPGLLNVALSKPAFLSDLAARLSGSIAIGGSITTLVERLGAADLRVLGIRTKLWRACDAQAHNRRLRRAWAI